MNLIGNQHIYRDKLIRNLLENNKELLLNNNLNNAVCYDGIIDESVYSNHKYRLAFLLKETNGNTTDGCIPQKYDDWDYVGWIKNSQSTGKEKIYPTLRNIAMWTSEFYDMLKYCSIDKETYLKDGVLQMTDDLYGSLRRIAIINLKKTFGGGTSNWYDIDKYLTEEVCNILYEEICIVEPTVILCGGREVFDFVLKIHRADKELIDFTYTKYGRKLLYMKVGGMLYVNFFHPACRKSREYLFDFAQDIFDTVCKML